MKTTGLIAIVFGYHKKIPTNPWSVDWKFCKKKLDYREIGIGMEENFISDRESDRPFFWDRDTPNHDM